MSDLSDFIHNAKFNPGITDPETGCTGYAGSITFEQCRQSYFLKKQDELLKQQNDILLENQNKNEATTSVASSTATITTMAPLSPTQQVTTGIPAWVFLGLAAYSLSITLVFALVVTGKIRINRSK
jgi:hypothetical protein